MDKVYLCSSLYFCNILPFPHHVCFVNYDFQSSSMFIFVCAGELFGASNDGRTRDGQG